MKLILKKWTQTDTIISFNKYFYKHKPLRSIEEVSAEIMELEKENEGLIMDILNLD